MKKKKNKKMIRIKRKSKRKRKRKRKKKKKKKKKKRRKKKKMIQKVANLIVVKILKIYNKKKLKMRVILKMMKMTKETLIYMQ